MKLSTSRAFVAVPLLALAASLFACTTTGGGNAHQNKTLNDKGKTKAGDKGPETAKTDAPKSDTPAAATGTPAAATTPVGQPPLAEQMAFIKTHRLPGSEFGEPEHQFVSTLPSSPEPGTVTEAAVVIGMIKTVLQPRHADAVTFKETDLGGSADDTKKALSLEQLCRDRGVNLPDALGENPLLGGFGIAKQVHDALALSGGSPEFKTEITLALKREAGRWSELGQSLAAPAAAEAQAEAAAAADDSAPPNPADLLGGDAVLGEAQALADRGNFLAAIRKAATISEASPMHAMAQEKIKEFSKTAVQELRKKAANAFQSAAPVTDAKTKAAYLKQAKTFLEEAIKNFPEAPQLPTVRDNLRAISRDLEKLEGESAGH